MSSRGAADERLVVAYLDHTAVLSGAEIALERTLAALVVDGRVQPVVLLAADGPLRQRLERLGLPVHVLPGRPQVAVRRDQVVLSVSALRPLVAAVGEVRRWAAGLRRHPVDVVHANSLRSALCGGLAASLVGRPLVWHVHDRVSPDYLSASAVRVLRLALRVLPAAVVANSRATLASLPPLRGVSVLHPPLPAAVPTGPRRRRDDGVVRVGVVGRLAPWKGQHVLLQALARLPVGTPVEAVVVGAPLFGETAYEAELHRFVEQHGLADRVRFAGFVTDVWPHLLDLDVLVHCSVVPEPFGQVVVEGMAAGCAVVAAAAGGPLEVVTDGVDGLLVPPGDVDGLAAALRLLVADGELRERLGRAARERARSFAPDHVADQLVDVYRTVLEGRRRPRPALRRTLLLAAACWAAAGRPGRRRWPPTRPGRTPRSP